MQYSRDKKINKRNAMAFKDVLYSWPWKAEELLEMIEWMRAFNANPAHQRKVKFYGFDMQAPNMAVSNVIAYLRSVDPEYAAKAAELLSGVPLTEADRSLVAGSSNTYQQVVEKIGQVLAHMDALTQDNAEWREARQDALVIQQSMRMMLAGDQGVALRDEAMAANVDWILTQEGSGTKIMLWAHNDHVRTALTEGKIWMGGHLRKRFGNEMVVMGFVFNQGAFRAFETNKELREFIVKPAPTGSLDAMLAATKIPLFVLDLRTANTQSVINWLRIPQKSREIGSRYSGDPASWQLEQSPAEAFDAIVFVETTSPTRGIPIPVTLPPSPLSPVQPPPLQPTPASQPDTKKPFWETE
jgi:erythromycin esterase